MSFFADANFPLLGVAELAELAGVVGDNAAAVAAFHQLVVAVVAMLVVGDIVVA